MPVLITALLIAFGAFTLAAQTVLFREYLVSCNGTEIGVGLFYATWFAWIAVGARLQRRLPMSEGGATRRLLGLLLLYVPAVALQVLMLRSLRGLAGVPPAELFPLGRLLWVTLLANAPVGLITGNAFPVACAVIAEREPSPARAATRTYVLESLGSFAGGLGATLLILAGRTPVTILAAATLGIAGIGGAAAWRAGWRGRAGALIAVGVLALALLVTPLGRVVEDAAEDARFGRALPGYERLASVDTPYRHLILGQRGDQLVALSDGTVLASYPDEDAQRLTGALLLAQRPAATRILLVGQGTEGLATELLRYDLSRLVLLQPDGDAAAAVAPHLGKIVERQLQSAAVQRLHGDPRVRLAELAQDTPRFDLVVLDLPDPTSASGNRTATVEFYTQCRALMSGDGVLARRITATVNYLGPENVSYGAATLATLGEVFDDVRLIPGETTWFVAGRRFAPTADPVELMRRYGSLPAGYRRVQAPRFSSAVEPRRVAAVTATYEAALAERGDALVNTDTAPIAYFLQLRVLARTVGSGLVDALTAARSAGIWLYLIPLLLGALAWIRGALLFPDPAGEGRSGGALLLGTAGAAAMATQVGLILAFQTRFGDLFLQVGWLNALFMAGLALGGLAGARWLRGAGGWRVSLVCGVAATIAAIVAVGVPRLVDAPPTLALAAFYGLVAAAGAAFGAIFPVAGAWVASRGEDAPGVGALLESADHWGAALGAAVVGVAMIPLLGSSVTAAVLAIAIAVTAVALPLPEWLRGARAGSVGARLAVELAGIGRRRIGVGGRASGALFAAGLALVAVAAVVRAGAPGPRIRFDPGQLVSLTEHQALLEVERPFVHYRGVGRGRRPSGDALTASMAVTDEIEGYGGPLNLLLVMDSDGTLRDVQLIESEETPAYLVGFDEWLGGLRGHSLTDPIDPGAAQPVDVLSGATVTSLAALRTVDEVRSEVGTRILGLDPPPRAKRPSPWTRWPVIALLALTVIAVPVLLSGHRLARTLLLLLSLGVAGAWCNQQLSAEHLSFLARLQFPAASNAEAAVLLGGALLLGLAFGPAYCGTLCPFGAIQEWVGRIRPQTPVSERLDRNARALKYGLLVVALAGFLVVGHGFLAFDPLQVFFGWRAPAAMGALFALSMIGAVSFPRFWCRYLCVVGAFLSLLNRVALLRRFLPRRRHDRCDFGVRSAGDWDCIQCNRCVGPQPERRWLFSSKQSFIRMNSDRLLLALLAGALVLAAVCAIGALRRPPLQALGQTRPVDSDQIRELIEQRELSGHPAEYWEPVE